MGKSLFALLAALLVVVLTSGCLEGGGTCPEEEGSVLCGLCSDANSPNSGLCFYCDAGQTCSGDVCGEYQCISPRTETPLFQFVGGQLVQTGVVVLPGGWIGDATYDNWIVITGDNSTGQLDGYVYSIEDPVNSPLPPGVTFTPDGHLVGMPTTPGDYVFSVCATSPAGERTCRDVSMHVGIPQPVPLPGGGVTPPLPPPEPPEDGVTPPLSPDCVFASGTINATEVLWMHGPAGSYPEDCVMEARYRFDIKRNGNAITGTATMTVLEVRDCWDVVSASVGQTSSAPITGTANGCLLKFSTREGMSAVDYTLVLTPWVEPSTPEGELSVESCHSPDTRCTCNSPDPRCPGERITDGEITGVNVETINWWATD